MNTNSLRSSQTFIDTTPLLSNYSNSSQNNSKLKTVFIFLLFFILGVAPQLVQNALFSETAVFKDNLPEEKQISAYMVTAFMVANIFCILYIFLQHKFSLSDRLFVHLILIGNLIDVVIIMFLWRKHTHIPRFGEVSSVILACSFVAGALGNTSTLVFFAFASRYHPIFTTAISTGYGASGLFSSVLSIIQRPPNIRFAVEVYFGIMVAVVALGIISFWILLRYGKSFLSYYEDSRSSFMSDEGIASYPETYNNIQNSDGYQPSMIETNASIRDAKIPLLNMLWTSVLTFFIPALIPYLSRDEREMTLLNSIFLVFPPIGALLSGAFKFYHLSLTSILETVLFAGILIPALTATKHVITVKSWVYFSLMICFGLVSGYNTTMVYLRVRRDFDRNPISIEKVCRWAALANQIGAMIGIFCNDIIIRNKLYA